MAMWTKHKYNLLKLSYQLAMLPILLLVMPLCAYGQENYESNRSVFVERLKYGSSKGVGEKNYLDRLSLIEEKSDEHQRLIDLEKLRSKLEEQLTLADNGPFNSAIQEILAKIVEAWPHPEAAACIEFHIDETFKVGHLKWIKQSESAQLNNQLLLAILNLDLNKKATYRAEAPALYRFTAEGLYQVLATIDPQTKKSFRSCMIKHRCFEQNQSP